MNDYKYIFYMISVRFVWLPIREPHISSWISWSWMGNQASLCKDTIYNGCLVLPHVVGRKVSRRLFFVIFSNEAIGS